MRLASCASAHGEYAQVGHAHRQRMQATTGGPGPSARRVPWTRAGEQRQAPRKTQPREAWRK
eukprot:6486378-Alexandrium_andersonii.AAC.1